MEDFLVQNAKRYQALVKAFKPGASTQTSTATDASTSPDIVVSTRIRPLLDEEASAGFSESVFPRDAQPGVVDVHELRRPVRGLPTLKVCTVLRASSKCKGAGLVCPTNKHYPSPPSTRWTECSAPMQGLRMFTTWCPTWSHLHDLGASAHCSPMDRQDLARHLLSAVWRRWWFEL